MLSCGLAGQIEDGDPALRTKPFYSGLDTLPPGGLPACLFGNSGCPQRNHLHPPPPPPVGVGQEWVGIFWGNICEQNLHSVPEQWIPRSGQYPSGSILRPAGFNRTWVRRTCRLGVPVGSAYFRPADRPAESPAVPSARRLGRPKVRPYLRPADRPAESTAVPSASRSAGRKYGRTFGRPISRPKVRFNPSPPLVLKGPQARRYTQKAVHTKGGVWPPQESCY